jgi:hypothetical protein
MVIRAALTTHVATAKVASLRAEAASVTGPNNPGGRCEAPMDRCLTHQLSGRPTRMNVHPACARVASAHACAGPRTGHGPLQRKLDPPTVIVRPPLGTPSATQDLSRRTSSCERSCQDIATTLIEAHLEHTIEHALACTGLQPIRCLLGMCAEVKGRDRRPHRGCRRRRAIECDRPLQSGLSQAMQMSNVLVERPPRSA